MSEQYGMGLHLHIISRKQAKALGMKHYFTGKPCKNGGVGPRRCSNANCSCLTCYRIDYSLRRDQYRKYRHENRDRNRLYAKTHYTMNRERIKEKATTYYQENRDQQLERQKIYRMGNPHKVMATGARRRAAKRSRLINTDCELTHLVEREAYDLARERKEQTGIEWHVDHMLPMQGDEVSGFHHWSNLQVIPASLNLHKLNRTMYTEPFEWLRGI